MHFYPHHISDFNHATRHLTRVERSVYRDLIELYYDTESPLDLDISRVSRRVMAVTGEEKKAVQDVLNEFFIKTEAGFVHERCRNEIEKYRLNTSAKAKAGAASAAKRQQNSTDVERVLNGCLTNQEPVTSIKNNTTVERVGVTERVNTREVAQKPPVDGLDLDVWIRWEAYRREIRRPLKPASILAAQHKLAAFGADQKAVVEQSIASGWQGLFALKSQGMPTGGNGHGKPRKLSTVERATAGRIAAELEIDELERQAHTAALGEDGAHLPRHMGATLR